MRTLLQQRLITGKRIGVDLERCRASTKAFFNGKFLNGRQPSLLQRVLEADAAEDAFDDDDYEVDTPKRRHRGKGRVSGPRHQWAVAAHGRAIVELAGVAREVTGTRGRTFLQITESGCFPAGSRFRPQEGRRGRR